MRLNKKVPFVSLRPTNAPIKQRFSKKISDIIDSGQFILGNELKVFQTSFASFNQTSFAIGVSSGFVSQQVLRLFGNMLPLRATGSRGGEPIGTQTILLFCVRGF